MLLSELLFDTTTLYHYASSTEPTLVLDPKRFGEQSYTRREKQTSDVPRVFFYLNPGEREENVSQGKTLYTATVPTTDIYDLASDPDGIKEQAKNNSGRIDFDVLLERLSGWRRDDTGKYTVKEPGLYQGARYHTGTFDVVVWFDKIVVHVAAGDDKLSLKHP